MTRTLVTRVLFDDSKAVGVEVIGNKNQDNDASQLPRQIRARKFVVVSAGAIGSALILQRSGVGEAARLSKLGISVVADLPAGANYEDHSSCIITYHVSDDVETLDSIMEGKPGVMEPYLAQFANGKGFLKSNVNDAGSKIRPSPKELEVIGPAFSKIWKRQYESAPDKPVFIQTIVNGFLGPRTVVPEKSCFMVLGNIAVYPISKGHVYITSTDPYSPPDFRTGFLEEQADVEMHVWMYKRSRETARRMPGYRGEYAPLHPRFPEGSAASCIRLDGPPSVSVQDLVYTPDDNIAVEEFVRERGGTTWHSVATVQMKPKDKGANTYSTALLVGEKAAILIAEDLGLILP
ncbi:unnamed protein product [Rhizoctonia solani]|uniref:Alcohol oxidase n=1 Tax=Rhizoctonia solani TaxID=456999 RepID=A0A8H3GYS9_9AGAM|nr:unnamed protein product [Rhizoctonia solani]